MRKCYAAVLLYTLPLFAAAADWQLVAETKAGKLQFDKASLAKQGAYTMAVLSYEFKDSQKVATPPYEVFTRRSDDVLVDCEKRTLGVTKRSFLDGDKSVGVYSLKPEEVKFNPAAPETMADTVVKVICAAAIAAKP